MTIGLSLSSWAAFEVPAVRGLGIRTRYNLQVTHDLPAASSISKSSSSERGGRSRPSSLMSAT